MVLGGGIFDSPYAGFSDRVREGVRGIAPRAVFRRLDGPPVLGAALLGLDTVGASGRSEGQLRTDAGRRATLDATAPSS